MPLVEHPQIPSSFSSSSSGRRRRRFILSGDDDVDKRPRERLPGHARARCRVQLEDVRGPASRLRDPYVLAHLKQILTCRGGV